MPVLSEGNSGAGQGPVQWLNRTVLLRQRDGGAALQSKGVCVTSAVGHSCGSRRCSWYIRQMPAEGVAVRSLLSRFGTCYSRTKQVGAGSQHSHKEQ